jgi:hypothetical protein
VGIVVATVVVTEVAELAVVDVEASVLDVEVPGGAVAGTVTVTITVSGATTLPPAATGAAAC